MIDLKSLYKFFRPLNWCQTDFVFKNPRQIRLFTSTTFWCQSGAILESTRLEDSLSRFIEKIAIQNTRKTLFGILSI